jgi:hypothetical protein
VNLVAGFKLTKVLLITSALLVSCSSQSDELTSLKTEVAQLRTEVNDLKQKVGAFNLTAEQASILQTMLQELVEAKQRQETAESEAKALQTASANIYKIAIAISYDSPNPNNASIASTIQEACNQSGGISSITVNGSKYDYGWNSIDAIRDACTVSATGNSDFEVVVTGKSGLRSVNGGTPY